MTTTDEMATAEIAARVGTLRAEVERTRADYEAILVHLSSLSGTVKDASKRRVMELVATVVAIDYELKVLLLKALAEPDDREVWLKHLALVAYTAIEELPPQVGADFRDAGRAFKDALKPIRGDADFMQGIETIRHKVIAHHELVDGDHWVAQWHLSAIAAKHNGTTVVRNKIVKHAGALLGALKVLGQALVVQHPDMFPHR